MTLSHDADGFAQELLREFKHEWEQSAEDTNRFADVFSDLTRYTPRAAEAGMQILRDQGWMVTRELLEERGHQYYCYTMTPPPGFDMGVTKDADGFAAELVAEFAKEWEESGLDTNEVLDVFTNLSSYTERSVYAGMRNLRDHGWKVTRELREDNGHENYCYSLTPPAGWQPKS